MNHHAQILIIEDDADINELTATYLRKQGFICTQAFSGSEARLLLQQAYTQAAFAFDVVITDLMLPGMSGQEVVSLIREHATIPIIVISALDTPPNKLELFERGVDDYLVKPFDLEELHARIVVQLRHAKKSGQNTGSEKGSAEYTVQDSTVRYREWVLDTEARSLLALGLPVKLTRTEFNILEALLSRPKKVFSKRELYEAVWNEDCFIEEKAINVHVSNIRAKLKESNTEDYIETVWGIGFKLADVDG